MRITVSTPGVITGIVFGTTLRYSLTFSEFYQPGWFWWFHRGLHASPGTAGFAGYVDPNVYRFNDSDVGYCLIVSLLPGLFGGVVGAFCGAMARPISGAALGGLISGIVLLLMRLPELYRPGWFGSLWFDYNLPMLVEAVVVGAVVGALSGEVGWFSDRLRTGDRKAEPGAAPDPART